jgi:membrane protein YdbS with pleckstrin-like domain
MQYSFNPNPIVGTLRILFLAILLSLIAYTFQTYIDRIFLALLGMTWLIAALYIAILYARAKFEVITMEEKAVRHTQGILSQKSVVLPYVKITEATYTQSLAQRLFSVGNLHLDSAGGALVAIHSMDIKKSDIDKIMADVRKNSGKGDGV